MVEIFGEHRLLAVRHTVLAQESRRKASGRDRQMGERRRDGDELEASAGIAFPIRGRTALQGRRLRSVTQLDAEARRMLDRALERLALSARGHDRVLRVARTIGDLGGADRITSEHLGEALQFRGDD